MSSAPSNDLNEILLRRSRRCRPGVLPADEPRAAEDRAAQWNSSLRPNNPFEVWIVDQVAVESLRIEGCRRRDSALRDLEASLAADPAAWDLDRKAEAQALGAGLARNPALVMAKLRRTKHGCYFLADRWSALLAVAGRKAAWNEAHRSLAMDLLGTPRELREGLDPLRIEGLEGDDLPDAQHALAMREMTQLLHLVQTTLGRRDEGERAMSAAATPATLSKAVEQTRRYEAACQRRLSWALAQLKRTIKAPVSAVAGESGRREFEEAMDEADDLFDEPESAGESSRLNFMMTGAPREAAVGTGGGRSGRGRGGLSD